jgi:type IV pilus assembly protein PilX
MNNQQMTATKLPNSNPILHSSSITPASPKAPTFGASLPASMQPKTPYQSGAVLIISLIMLLLLTLIGTSSMQSTSLEEKMAGNMRDKSLAFQAAESALKAAESSLPPAVSPTDSGTGGIYSSTSTIPTAAAILTDAFWTTNPVATSTVTGLGNNITTPLYIIQDMGMICTTTTLPCPASDQKQTYRITTRATGGTTNAVVILQSVYSPS